MKLHHLVEALMDWLGFERVVVARRRPCFDCRMASPSGAIQCPKRAWRRRGRS